MSRPWRVLLIAIGGLTSGLGVTLLLAGLHRAQGHALILLGLTIAWGTLRLVPRLAALGANAAVRISVLVAAFCSAAGLLLSLAGPSRPFGQTLIACSALWAIGTVLIGSAYEAGRRANRGR
jgi:hypothetical protein